MRSKNVRKKVIIIASIVLVLAAGVFLFFKLTQDENKINIIEKRWITNNSKNNLNIGVVNDVNVIGKDGKGILFDFFDSLKEEYDLNFNYISDGKTSGLINVKTTFDSNTTNEVFYKDHFVLIAKEFAKINDVTDLNGKKIGLLSSDKALFERLESISNIFLTTYDSKQDMLNAYENGTVEYLFIPLYEYADYILSTGSSVNYHLNDFEKIYYFENGNESNLNSIIKKYNRSWKQKNLITSYNDNMLSVLKSNLAISEKDFDVLTSKTYNYGLTNYDPYEIYDKGKLNGLVAEYINNFSDITDIEFKIKEYNSLDKLDKSISTNSVDIFFGYYYAESNFNVIKTPISLDYYVVSSELESNTYHSLNSLKDTEIYVLERSLLHKYLSDNKFTKIKTYEDYSDMKSANKDGSLIILDTREYNFYKDYLSESTIRYSGTANVNYSFYLNGDATLNKLFSAYVTLMDSHQLDIKGTLDYYDALASDNILYTIAKYFIFALILLGIVFYYKFRNKNRVIVSKRIKRDDKIKYIDSLTSLKNRAYLSDNIEAWNKNRVYPQTTIIVDLNNVAYINDNFGSVEGDKQIKASANVLIKTQLDNSDIIRTDGNEFLVYLIGYEEKKIVNYIRKLHKEFAKLPYEYGAAIGYSMISDDIKTLDDAINEATLDMRSKKEIEENVEEVQKDN